MKRFTTIFLLVGLATAQVAQVSDPAFVNNANPAGGSAAYIFQENFEGTGYENAGWTESGTPNEDYTPALQGSQSWSSSAQASYAVYDLGQTYDSINVFFQWKRAGAASTPQLVQLLDESDTVVAALAAGNGQAIVYNGTTGSANFGSSDLPSYYFWLEFTKGTGSNGSTLGYNSTTATKPGSASGTVTTGNATTGVRKIKLIGGSSFNFIVDKIRVSTASIGSDPS